MGTSDLSHLRREHFGTTGNMSPVTFPNPHRPLQYPSTNIYGSDFIAARYCGLKAPPMPAAGLWQHGWISDRRTLVQAEQVFGASVSHLKSLRYWVATKFLEKFLCAKGLVNSLAIGLPIVYTQQVRIDRQPSSLLVMPVHSMPGSRNLWDADGYVKAIVPLRSEFQDIVVCCSAHCWETSCWVREFRAAGFEVIRGADGDPFTLEKMANLGRRCPSMEPMQKTRYRHSQTCRCISTILT
jgi:hypothetical protein